MITLKALGGVDLRDAQGRPVEDVLRQPKRTALLVYLALAKPGGFHRRDTLIALFWPELDEKHGRASLRKSLYVLRQALGPETLRTRGDEEVAVDPTLLWSDVGGFDAAIAAGQLEAALELYRGDLLEGFYASDCAAEFDHWVEAERLRLRKAAADAAWKTSEAQERQATPASAVKWARRAFQLTPHDELALRRLLSLLDRVGDRSQALRTYQAFTEQLANAYDAEPSLETQALIEEIRSRTTEGEVTAAAGAAPAVPAAESVGHATEPALADAAAERVPSGPAGQRPGAKQPAKEAPWRTIAGISVALLVVILMAAPLLNPRGADLAADRVLVVPFENRTADSSLDPLGDMAADWIGRGLTETGLVEVVPHALAGRDDRTPAGAATQAGAGTLISGSYYRQGDSLQFQVQILDVAESSVVRSIGPIAASVGDPMVGVEILRQRVMGSIASMLESGFDDLARAARQPPSFEAYRLFMEGEEASFRNAYGESLQRYYRAAALDTNYLFPLVRAVVDHFNAGQCAKADSLGRELQRRRERLSRYEGYYLDRGLAWCRGDWNAAYRASKQLAELAPNSSLARYAAARSALFINRPAEAVEQLRQVDPGAPSMSLMHGYYRDLATGYHMLGQHERELETAHRAREAYPDLLDPVVLELRALAPLGRVDEVKRLVDQSLATAPKTGASRWDVMRTASDELLMHGHPETSHAIAEQLVGWIESRVDTDPWELAQALYRAGRYSEASVLVDSLASTDPSNFYFLAGRGLLAARVGNRDEAERISTRLAEIDYPYFRGRNTLIRARIAAILGEKERAVSLLRDALAEGVVYSWSSGFFDDDIDFADLRDYPAYRDLLRPKG